MRLSEGERRILYKSHLSDPKAIYMLLVARLLGVGLVCG